MGVRAKVGFKDSVGVSLGYLWCSWSVGRHHWQLTVGRRPLGGRGVGGVGVLGAAESPPPPGGGGVKNTSIRPKTCFAYLEWSF